MHGGDAYDGATGRRIGDVVSVAGRVDVPPVDVPKVSGEGYARSDTLTSDADAAWRQRTFAFLARRAYDASEWRYKQLSWDLVVDVPPRIEADPFLERPPTGWRAKLAWVSACAAYPIRRELGLLHVEPGVRWDLKDVKVQFSFGFSPDGS